MSDNPIVNFYTGHAKDHRGRHLEEVLRFTDEQIESIHDYIQWLFPLETISPVNPHAPICDKETKDTFRLRAELRKNLCRACFRMLTFYGLDCMPINESRLTQIIIVAYPKKLDNWLSPNNHNHLRLTRMLKSLRLLGLEGCSSSLYQCLMKIASGNSSKVSEETICYWTDSQK